MKVYLDSCVLVYLLEAAPNVIQTISGALQQLPGATFYISPLVQLECLVLPTRQVHNELIADYEELFADFNLLPTSPAVFTRALQLRAFHNLKTPDALHVATALEHGCTEFWTNDLRLSRSTGELAFRVLP